VDQDLLDLIHRDAVAYRALRANAQLLVAPQTGQDAQREDEATSPVEPGTALRVPPGNLSHRVLKGHHELVGAAQTGPDVLMVATIPLLGGQHDDLDAVASSWAHAVSAVQSS